MILIHGRGASASDIMGLHREMRQSDLAAIAPQAAGHSWYPYSFLSPRLQNEPWLNSALARLETIVSNLIDHGIPSDKLILLGFSQGACLSAEFAASHPRRYGAVIGLTGGLIGAPGELPSYTGSLAGTPIFLGTSDPDPHVPYARVEETAQVMKELGGNVTLRRYGGMGHTINQAELDICRDMVQHVLASGRASQA